MSDIKLYNGDCLELMKDISDESVDMVLCDLPYGTTACRWDNVIPFEPLWEQYNRIIKNNGAVVLFGQEPFSSRLRLSNIDLYRYDLYWQKEKPTNVFTITKQFGRVIETISIFYKHQPTYNPIMRDRRNITNPKPMRGNLNIYEANVITGTYKHSDNYNPTKIYPINILRFNRDSKKGHSAVHPTQKPVELLEYLIKTYTNEGDTVLDNCMGSGSTGVAAKNLNRDFIGIELDKNYFEIAKERITNNGIVKINDDVANCRSSVRKLF